MGENPALYSKRVKDIEEIDVEDNVKVFLVDPSDVPGIELGDKDALYGKVKSKNPRKGTIRVKLKIYEDEEDKKEIEKEIDPSVQRVYKGGKRRSTASKKRIHRSSHRTLKNLRKRRATQKH